MNGRLLICGLALLCLCAVQCSDSGIKPDQPNPPQLSAAEKQMVTAANDFSFDIFREIVDWEADTNIFISPLSISFALGMTYNGANGETEQAMREVLGYGELSDSLINLSYKNLMTGLIGLDPKVLFEIANSIWIRQGFEVEPDFIEVNQGYFDAAVRALNFNDDASVDTINNWISEKTHDKIKDVLQPPIDPTTVMFLVNAIYFKGTWTYEFDPDNTEPGLFNLMNGEQKTVDMMSMETVLPRYFNDDFQAVELAYGNGDFCMSIFLPRPGNSVNDLAAEFTAENWQDWLGQFKEDTLELYLPKFKYSYGTELNDVLKSLGMAIAFDAYNADFTGINKLIQLFISRVIHKAFVQVDEKGTEAAAVTVVVIEYTSIGPEERLMVVDRPFIFVIHEKNTGAIMFMGKVVNPVWED